MNICRRISKNISVARPSLLEISRSFARKKKIKEEEINEEFSEKKEPAHFKEFEKYFSDKTLALIKELPAKLLQQKQKPPDHIYLVGEQSVPIIASTLTESKPAVPIVEVNPGLGYLSQKLIQSKSVPKFFFVDVNDSLLTRLEELLYQNPTVNYKKVSFIRSDFVGLWRLVYLDKTDNGNRTEKLLSNLPKTEWLDSVGMKIFVPSGSLAFFKHLITSIIHNNNIGAIGRYDLYAVLPPRLYIHLISNRKAGYYFYRTYSILFQTFFEFKFIAKLPRKDFLPWPAKRTIMKVAFIESHDLDSLYFVKITPRKNLFEFLPQDQMQQFLFFIRQNCISRKTRVIPALETWIPGIGKKLILLKPTSRPSKIIHSNHALPDFCSHCYELRRNDFYPNMNIYTEFGDLSPNQLLSLFIFFRNLPEFEESLFLSSMETSLLKQTNTEDTINDIEQPVEEVEETGVTGKPKTDPKIN